MFEVEALAGPDLDLFLQPLLQIFKELVIRCGQELGNLGMYADHQSVVGVQVALAADLAQHFVADGGLRLQVALAITVEAGLGLHAA